MSTTPARPRKTLILGGPRTGKTTLAGELAAGRPVYHTDQLVGTHEWSAASAVVAQWFDELGDEWVIEGVTAIRGLRKWLAAHPEGSPADEIIWLKQPRERLSHRQLTMMKGCITIMSEILPELEGRGIAITWR